MGCATPADEPCDPKEKPAHDVRLSRGFWMGQTETSVAAYKRFSLASGKAMPPEPRDGRNPRWTLETLPMTMTSWDDARAFCEWAGGRLPTEAEWEYAARAGKSGKHYGELDGIAWGVANAGGKPHPVGQKAPNTWKLHDMIGNVAEWTADWYKDSYDGAQSVVDPRGPAAGQFRVFRGRGFPNDAGQFLRASFRGGFAPTRQLMYIGFRCVL